MLEPDLQVKLPGDFLERVLMVVSDPNASGFFYWLESNFFNALGSVLAKVTVEDRIG